MVQFLYLILSQFTSMFVPVTHPPPQLQETLAVSEERRASEVRVMRAEVTRALTDLNDRDLTVASLSERTSASERDRREQFEQMERTTAELHVSDTLSCVIIGRTLYRAVRRCHNEGVGL